MKLPYLLPSVVLAAAFLSGCGSSSTAPNPGTTTSPADEVKAIVADDPSADPGGAGYDGSDAILESAPLDFGQSSAPGLASAATDTCWFRQLQSTSATLTASGDTASMSVTLTRVNSGVLNVGACPTPGQSLFFTKNYTVTWTRAGTYTKGATVDPNLGEENSTAITRWRMVSASLPHTMLNAGDPVIDSVQFSKVDGSVSRTYTDPEALEDPTTWPQLAVGDSVQVKVYTSGPVPVMAFVHFDVSSGVHPRLQRRRLQYSTLAGAYQGAFVIHHGYFVGRPRGWRVRQAIWVDLVTRATLRDSGAGYAASGWGVPYRLQHPSSPSFAFNR